jgi:hypothetical protein
MAHVVFLQQADMAGERAIRRVEGENLARVWMNRSQVVLKQL